MDPRDQIERQMDRIEAAYARGEIDHGEYTAEMRALQMDLREAAEDAAEHAYRDTMGW
jgi:hypothetical protein